MARCLVLQMPENDRLWPDLNRKEMKRIFVISLLWSSAVAMEAQHVDIRGKIVDNAREALEGAAVAVYREDSVLVGGAVSGAGGDFELKHLPADSYRIVVSYVGYAPGCIRISGVQKMLDLGIIALAPDTELKEVVVRGSSFIRKKDRLLIIPDRQQIKHAYTGYDLLYNLMIPGVSVDRRQGTVSTSKGGATLYINGRKADFREIQNLRPKDIEKIEYYDNPTDEYLGDVASINYIVKEYKTGGYVSLDGEQNIGYLKGDYNAGFKITHNRTDYMLFAGHNLREYDGVHTRDEEHFNLGSGGTVDRNTETESAACENDQQYVQFKVSNHTAKRMLTGTVSLVRDNTPHNDLSESFVYLDGREGNRTVNTQEFVRQNSLKPAVSLDGVFQMKNSQRLRVMLNSAYSRNDYQRDYSEQDWRYTTDVGEDLYSFSGIATYSIKLKHNNSFGGNIQHYHNITSSAYGGSMTSSQHLWMGETISFLSYSQDIGKRFTLNVSPGVSLLNYNLNHGEARRFWTFRTNTWLRYNLNPNHQLVLGFAIGNEQADISYLNTASQAVDSLQTRRGNPFLDNPKIHDYFFNYRAQISGIGFQFNAKYTRYLNNISYAYSVEDGKLVSSYQSDDSYSKLRLEGLCSCRISDNLRTNVALRYEHMNVPQHAQLKEDNFFASIDLNYFIGSFTVNAYAKTTERKLDQTTLAFVKNPASYGLSVRYNGKNWMAEAGAENSFTKQLHYREYADYGVYRYSQTRTSPIYQQTAYIRLAYTFGFGKKVSKDSNYIDRNINSAILKSR